MNANVPKLINAEEIAKARKACRLAEAEAREAHLLAKAKEAEPLAKLCLDKANLDVEEKLTAFKGSSILSTLSKIKSFSSSHSHVGRNISNHCVKSENGAKTKHRPVQSSKPESLPVNQKFLLFAKGWLKPLS